MEAAKDAATKLAFKESGVQTTATNLRTGDAASYARSLQILKLTGTPLEMAAATFAKCFEILGGDNMIEAARTSPGTIQIT